MILDTNALSAFLEDDTALLPVLEPQTELHFPVVVLGEYRFGLIGSRIRRQAEARLDDLERICVVLGIGALTARFYAEIRHELRVKGHPIPENDIWIAALARQYRLPVLSRDRHFDAVKGLRRIGW
jgi:predicted nucleic acid-binding protein